MPAERVPNQELLSLKGKIALVTGAARGIGLEVARRLHESEATVVVSDIDEIATLDAVSSFLPSWNEIKADVSNQSDVEKMVEHVTSWFGGVDILVNNAGIYPFKPMLQLSYEEWRRVISTNLDSTFMVNQAIAKQMVSQGRGGKIINIGSVDSLKPWAIGSAAYDASKAGILGMSRSLALELAPHGITVNVIAPGDIDTPGSRTGGIEPLDLSSTKIPIGRRGKADDIAKVALSLASSISDYITGTITVVDGGWMLTSSNTQI